MTLREQLIRDEGIRFHPYRDSEGFLTIGIGRNLDAKGISSTEAEFLLDNDINAAEADVLKHIPWAASLDDVRYAALLNLCFNMGIGDREHGLMSFRHMLEELKAGRYDLAAAHLLNSQYAGQVGPRAHRVAEQIRTGEWT